MFSLTSAMKIAGTILKNITEYEEYDNCYVFKNPFSKDCVHDDNEPVAVMKKDGNLITQGMSIVLNGQAGDLVYCGNIL